MLAEIETLLVIQERDQQIMRLRKDLEQIPLLKERADSKLNQDREAVTKAKEALQANEIAIKKLELDIGTRETTIGKLKQQQFETRKNEEYQALGHEVVRYGEEVRKLEDSELELMETGESLRAALKAAEEALARTQELVNDDLQQLDERKANEEARIEELQEERKKYVPRVDETLFQTYERILAKKRDAAVVPVLGGQCKGCHMKVTAATVADTKAEQQVTHCPQCGRLLYYEG